jgi:hypothetical protein
MPGDIKYFPLNIFSICGNTDMIWDFFAANNWITRSNIFCRTTNSD